MAWVEKRGNKWRVRYWKPDGKAGTVPGSFESEQAARDYAAQLTSTPQQTAPPTTPHLPAVPAPPPPASLPEPVVKPAVTLAEWAEIWWQTIDVSANTEAFYRSLLTCHILPRWDTTPITQITAVDIKIWLNKLRARYSTTTVSSVRKLFAMLMTDAVDDQLITTNPVRPQRRGRGRLEPRIERPWANEHQILAIAHRILRLASRNQCLLVITAAYTGMRWGELAGLHRDNLDLKGGRIYITTTGALHEVNGHLTLGHPKTRSSVRTVTLPPFLIQLLTIDLAASTRPFVFTTLHGKALRRSGFQRRLWAPAVNGGSHAGETWTPIVPSMTFHGTRHTHKTWLIEDHIPEVAQARRLGHAMHNKIDDVYSHVAPSVETRLLQGLETRWQRSLERYRQQRNTPALLDIAS
jgi:integrase